MRHARARRRAVVALARGTVLAVLPTEDGPPQRAASAQQHQRAHIHCAQHPYTALAWFVQLRARAEDDGQPAPLQQPAPAPARSGGARRADAADLAEDQLLLSGTADGCLQLHDAHGVALFRQQLSTGPVLDILVRPHCSGTCEQACVRACVHVRGWARREGWGARSGQRAAPASAVRRAAAPAALLAKPCRRVLQACAQLIRQRRFA